MRFSSGLIEVTEVDNMARFQNLKVHNKSPTMVLILDGGTGGGQAESDCEHDDSDRR